MKSKSSKEGAPSSIRTKIQQIPNFPIFAGVIIRVMLVVYLPSLHNVLLDRIEVATPVSNFKRLQEGLFLFLHDINPYEGGIFHQVPSRIELTLIIGPIAATSICISRSNSHALFVYLD